MLLAAFDAEDEAAGNAGASQPGSVGRRMTVEVGPIDLARRRIVANAPQTLKESPIELSLSLRRKRCARALGDAEGAPALVPAFHEKLIKPDSHTAFDRFLSLLTSLDILTYLDLTLE